MTRTQIAHMPGVALRSASLQCEAQAQAALEVGQESFESQFQALDQDSDIEDQLAALKRSLAPGNQPSLPAGS